MLNCSNHLSPPFSTALLQSPAMDPSGGEIAVELLPLIRTYKDGRIERLYGSGEFVQPSLDPATGVTSKDVLIDPDTNLSARLFLPDLTSLGPSQRLPVLVYYHGGGFCAQSPLSPYYHNFINSLVAQAKVIALSVDYRLAPEHPLPAAYEDASRTLQWLASHAVGPGPGPGLGLEPWLAERGDISHVFLAGDSAGANIVHNLAMRTKAKIEGVILIHPHFWGSKRMGCEKDRADKPFLEAEMLDRLWPFAWGGAAESDDPRVNPMAEGAPSLAGLACGRALVVVAERDVLRDRGRAYYDALRGSGWGGVVELLETEAEDHVFHLLKPGCHKAVEMMAWLAGFLRVSGGSMAVRKGREKRIKGIAREDQPPLTVFLLKVRFAFWKAFSSLSVSLLLPLSFFLFFSFLFYVELYIYIYI